MAYFPFFMDLSRRKGLIVGGGAVALRKARALLEYEAKLTVAAPELLPEFRKLPGVRLLRQPFTPELLEGTWFVIAATDDPDENRKIAALCRQRDILVNVVDDREACTFLFPARARGLSFRGHLYRRRQSQRSRLAKRANKGLAA